MISKFNVNRIGKRKNKFEWIHFILFYKQHITRIQRLVRFSVDSWPSIRTLKLVLAVTFVSDRRLIVEYYSQNCRENQIPLYNVFSFLLQNYREHSSKHIYALYNYKIILYITSRWVLSKSVAQCFSFLSLSCSFSFAETITI